MTTVLLIKPRGMGWGPITAMARLAAELLEAQLIEIDDRPLTRSERLRALLPRLRGDDELLVVAPVPEALNFVALAPGIRSRYRSITGWVIDCWWTDRIPVSVRRGRLFDRVLVTERGVVSDWQEASTAPVAWLPLGADVLGAIRTRGRARDYPRPIDLQRMGRQPEAWDDDETVSRACREVGLTFRGRPPFGESAEESYRNVIDADAGSRALLAFSNLSSPALYTHPTREYVTSRWLDALAVGTMVVGRRPREDGSDDLLWDGATVDISVDDASRGALEVAGALEGWSPDRAQAIQDEALRRLDWRWRFRQIAQWMGVRSLRLETELAELEQSQPSKP